MRGGWIGWLLAIGAGLLVLVGVVALVGNSDRSGETVSAAAWADRSCAVIATWRGEIEAIVEDIRTPTAVGSGAEEPQSETPQGRTGLIREGLDRAVSATETLITGIESAGIPDTPNGTESAETISDWATSALGGLEFAENTLDDEAGSLEESIEQLTTASRAIVSALTDGVRALAEISETDPELAEAVAASGTCAALRAEEGAA